LTRAGGLSTFFSRALFLRHMFRSFFLWMILAFLILLHSLGTRRSVTLACSMDLAMTDITVLETDWHPIVACSFDRSQQLFRCGWFSSHSRSGSLSLSAQLLQMQSLCSSLNWSHWSWILHQHHRSGDLALMTLKGVLRSFTPARGLIVGVKRKAVVGIKRRTKVECFVFISAVVAFNCQDPGGIVRCLKFKNPACVIERVAPL
jgi:hypothetical protein